MEVIVPDEYQQLSFFYPVRPFYALTETRRQMVRDSFSGFFRREILPLIPTRLVGRLYSGKNNVRPAKFMVEEVAARLYIKAEGLDEAYFLKHVHTDAGIQYALGTENLAEQPFSRNTFKRQRERIRLYNNEYDADIWNEITGCIDAGIAKKMGLSKRFSESFQEAYRIDSMMIDGHGANMTRLEIIYSTISLACSVLRNLGVEDYIPRELSHYLDKKDHNRLLYYKGTMAEIEAECKKHNIFLENADSNNQDNASEVRKRRLELIAELRIAVIIQEIQIAIQMLESVGLTDIPEYSNLTRLLDDQTEINEKNERIPKDKKDIKGSSLQNPYDPEITYRSKNKMGFHGYSAFFAEQFNSEGDGIIAKRYFEQNIYSDQEFAKRFYDEFSNKTRKTIAVCADALFTSHELLGLTDQKGIAVFCASTTGRPPNTILADFVFNDDRTEIIKCPMGNKVSRSEFIDKNGGTIKISFDSICCQSCQYIDACHAKTLKRNPHSRAEISLNQVVAATNIRMLRDPIFREMVNKRNAVEGIPSVMRRKYDIDEVQYFGKQYAAENFYSSCTAYNTRKLYRYLQRKHERNSSK